MFTQIDKATVLNKIVLIDTKIKKKVVENKFKQPFNIFSLDVNLNNSYSYFTLGKATLPITRKSTRGVLGELVIIVIRLF